MSAKPHPQPMTVAEYLAHERAAEYKSDYIDGRLYPVHDPYRRGDPAAMAGASPAHNRAKENLIGELFARLRACGCQSFSSDQRIRVPQTGRFNYPDIVIVCEPPVYADDDRDTLVNARVVIEVLSESTKDYDQGLKFAGYKQQPSIREVLFVAQDQPRVIRHVREPNGDWSKSEVVGLVTEFVFATIPVRVPMADVYRDVPLIGTGDTPE